MSKGISRLITEAMLTTSNSPDDAVVADALISDLGKKRQRKLLRSLVIKAVANRRGTDARSSAKSVTRPVRGASRSQANNQSAYQLMVRWNNDMQRIVALGDGTRVAFGDLTGQQLLDLAQERRAKAADLITEAERWERIADAVLRAGVAKVSDLPPQVL